MKTTLRLISIPVAVVALAATVARAQMPPHPVPHGSTENLVVGGAPSSTVSEAATETAELGALTTPEEIMDVFEPEAAAPSTTEGAVAATTAASQLDVEVGGGSSSVGGQDMDIYTVRVPYSRKLSERGTLQFSLPMSFATYKDALMTYDASTGLTRLEDAQAYGAGLNIAYAHQAVMKGDSRSFRWKLTPSGGLFYRDCSDLNLGAWVWNIGVSSSLAWQFAPGWVVNFGNSISFSWSDAIKDYPDPIRDNQQMLTNGIQLYRMLDRWTIYGYILDTEALRDVLVDSYQTYGMGVGYKITKKRSIRFTAIYEDGNAGYHGFRVTMGSSWRF